MHYYKTHKNTAFLAEAVNYSLILIFGGSGGSWNVTPGKSEGRLPVYYENLKKKTVAAKYTYS
jgi:hypothetical protein